MSEFRKLTLLTLTVLTSFLFGTFGVVQADPLKIGFVYVGPIGDHGWSYEHNQGRIALEKEFGSKVKTTYVESVPEGADAQRVINQLAAKGHNLIFTTSKIFLSLFLRIFPEGNFNF